MVFQAFRTQGETAVHPTIMAILDDHVVVGTVVGILVGKRALTTFHGDGVVVHVHIASMNQHVMADVDVYGIRAGALHTLCRRVDEAVEVFHSFALVEMVGPERTVHELYVLHSHILGVGYIDQPGALFVLVGACPVPLPSYPELSPIMVSIAIDSARSGDHEAIDVVHIHQGREIFASLTFYPSFLDGKVFHAVGAFQFASFLDEKVGSLLEK